MEIRLTTGETIPIDEGESLLAALRRNGVYLVSSCGGKGTCGKCRVKVLEGDPGMRATGKLTAEDKRRSMALACRSFPRTDVLVEVPELSRLVVGDKIAVSRASELTDLLKSFGVGVRPILSTIGLALPPPTLHDNISDLDRLRRALDEKGISGVRFSHGFAASLAKALRRPGWDVTLGYTDSGQGPEAIYISPVGECCGFGLSVDIGTTTVVAYLVDLSSGALIEAGSTYNSQLSFGDDVITRIVHATEGGGLGDLREAVVSDINGLLEAMLEKHGINNQDVKAVSISGNTTMSHLFWGLDPGYIREEPYIPTINSFPVWKAGTAGLSTDPQAPVYTLPCVASYVGGDIVSGVLASKMHRGGEISLFMDIGTNGEIAIGNSEWLVTAACSAGPCFEGSGIRHGMRATAGAVESVSIDPGTLEPEAGVIGGGRPTGICGSGMVDVLSELFLRGVIDRKGNFKTPPVSRRARRGEDGMEYIIYKGGGGTVSITEADIENILRAKAAIYAGVSLLLAEVGLGTEDVRKVYIAGGFGRYLNIERAVTLGMLPDIPRERFSYLGNASAAGAYLALLSSDLRAEAEAIASRMTYIELSVSRGFMEEYMSAMFLPHTDMRLFPSVESLLAGRG